MKKYTLIFLLSFLNYEPLLVAQVSSCEQVQKDVLTEINLVESFNQKYQETFADMSDSLRIHNELLKQNLVYFIESGGYKTCPINFPALKFVQSPDQNMMAVSWNTHMGGTMIDFASIIGYALLDGTIRTKRMEPEFQGVVENDKIFIDKIYTIKNRKKETIFLVTSHGQGSTLTPYFSMAAYKVGAELMKVPIFAGQTELSVNFDYTNDNTSYLPKDFNGIQFLKKGMFVRKPISEKNGVFKGRYEIYKFDGSKYFRMK